MKLYRPTRGFITTASLATVVEQAGTYVAYLMTPKSAQNICAWAHLMGVTDVCDPDDMHATIMYSPVAAVDRCRFGDHDLPMPMSIGSQNLPRTQILGKPGSQGALVTTFDSQQLAARHRYWRDEGLEHSFPDFMPHCTLSYNASAVPQEVLARLMRNPCQLPIDFNVERVTACQK